MPSANVRRKSTRLILLMICFFLVGRDLKFHGPFHCLNHKVDLTRNEAENTLFQRQEQLEQ